MEQQIYIIGGGIAGLVAAYHLEQANLRPVILEASDRPGGRVKTDRKDGFLLDHGFQVLLTAYEEARRYLDFDALDLHAFESGALIYEPERQYRISDPLREPGQLFNMLRSPVGTLRDKWLTYRLTLELKRTPNPQLFDEDVLDTLSYLRKYGFSERMINTFFRPFFGGIFLENDLHTPASMFRFVFKMFSLGEANLPRKGIEAIVHQLTGLLKHTTIRTQAEVTAVEGGHIQLAGDQRLPFHKCIIATDPAGIVPGLQGQELEYVNTSCYYFYADKTPISGKRIGLVADPKSRINNFCVLSDVCSDYAPQDKSLLSITLRDIPESSVDPLYIGEELETILGKSLPHLTYLAHYVIPKALPVIGKLQYEPQFTEMTLTNDIFLAGDYLLNASLDAAMRSGRLAAEGLRRSLA